MPDPNLPNTRYLTPSGPVIASLYQELIDLGKFHTDVDLEMNQRLAATPADCGSDEMGKRGENASDLSRVFEPIA